MRNRDNPLLRCRVVGLAVAAALLAACGSVQIGRDFDAGVFDSRVQRGATTRDEVRAWLGAPANTGVAVDANGERDEEWTYYSGQGSLPGLADATFKMLQVRFDSNGRVRSYSWSGEPAKAADGKSK